MYIVYAFKLWLVRRYILTENLVYLVNLLACLLGFLPARLVNSISYMHL